MFIKKLVSGTRRRYEEAGYDIDLSYICQDRIIAMSYPAQGIEKNYRNNYLEVSKNWRHHYHNPKYL